MQPLGPQLRVWYSHAVRYSHSVQKGMRRIIETGKRRISIFVAVYDRMIASYDRKCIHADTAFLMSQYMTVEHPYYTHAYQIPLFYIFFDACMTFTTAQIKPAFNWIRIGMELS